MGWVADNVIAEMRGSHQLGIFLRLATDPALHLWLGVNDIPAGIDSVDSSGTVYLGGGRLIGVPTLEILVNGTADSVDFTVSGIDPSAGQRMIDSIPAIRGAPVHMGLTTLDQYFQAMSAIIPIWQGSAAYLSEASSSVGGTDNQTLNLSLTVATGESTRSRASRSLWSSAMQKAIVPTDKFCDQTARIARGVQPAWPNY
ncbi:MULTISPECIES: hypothetical protein [unclassified Rhizobium]